MRVWVWHVWQLPSGGWMCDGGVLVLRGSLMRAGALSEIGWCLLPAARPRLYGAVRSAGGCTAGGEDAGTCRTGGWVVWVWVWVRVWHVRQLPSMVVCEAGVLLLRGSLGM